MVLARASALWIAAAGCRSDDPRPAPPRGEVESPPAAASSASESIAQDGAPVDVPVAIPTIAITGASFGDLRAGTPLSEEAIRRTFPAATFRKVDGVARGGGPAWIVEREADGLVAAADADKIVVEGGAVELHGVRADDDVSAMVGRPFAKTTCSVDQEGDDPICSVDGVSLRVGHCPAPQPRGKVPVARLAGCKVREMWWFAVVPPDE